MADWVLPPVQVVSVPRAMILLALLVRAARAWRRRRRLDGEAVQRAIAIVERSRHSHLSWLVYARAYPRAADLRAAGDAAHHERCIADYDHVLRVLRRECVSDQRERLP